MRRKDFLKRGMLAAAGVTFGSNMVKAKNIKLKESNYDKMMEQVGFNHLPNNEKITMNTVFHKANTRGHANHGWLDSHHTFSFANYYNPERMHFGVLRVLNDDIVSPGKGFGTHPHDNMEIISIPISGDLEHKDSMGNSGIIKQGDIQVMSAGTGVYHSEFNSNDDKDVKFLQIWLFPNKKNVEPRYDQISLNSMYKKNAWNQILSPNAKDEGVWIHQDAWFHMGDLEKGKKLEYDWRSEGNGLYVFLLDGKVNVGDQQLNKRDGYGVWNTSSISFEAKENSKVLLMEVPMQV